jgi:hypothetical protein
MSTNDRRSERDHDPGACEEGPPKRACGGVGPATARSAYIAPIVPTGCHQTLEYAMASPVMMMAMTPSLKASNRELLSPDGSLTELL